MQLKSLGNLQIAKDVITQNADDFKIVSDAVKNLSKEYKATALASSTLSDAQKMQILINQGLTAEEAKQAVATATLSTSQKTATGTTTGLSTAFKGLAASLGISTTALGALTAGITVFAAGLVAFRIYKQHIEDIRQATEEAANTYSEATDSISDYVEKYQELREALIAAKGNEEETYNVKKQLLDLQTELNDKFGEEYGALNLVTDAYKDQTEAIKAYNKEAAQSYLNENEKGIKRATREMTGKDHYNLSYTGISSASDGGKTLKEIAEKYADQGVRILDELGDGSQFSIHLEADPQSAYDTINAFETDVRNKAKELGDEHMFDDILDISSDSLNDAKSIIDEWGGIYHQSLLANIVKDDTLSAGYNKAINTVEEYNEAVLQSEDPYNDENVAKARQNLQSISEELSGEEWEKYGSVVQDVFDQADTSVYDFNQALKNDDGLKSLEKNLQGLSNLDLQSFNPGENEAFDKLKESAKEYGVSVENLIDALVRLGVVQCKTVSAAPEIEEPDQWDYSTTVTQLDTIKEKFDVLDSTLSKLYDADSQIGFEDFSSINEAFKELDGIEHYIQRLQEAGQDTEAVTAVMEDLIGSYLEYSGVLDNVTDENRQLITSMLEEMGVANAEAVVNGFLTTTTAEINAAKQALGITTENLADLTLEEIQRLIEEGNCSEQTKNKLYELYLTQIDLNNNPIDATNSINQLLKMVDASSAAGTALTQLASIMGKIGQLQQYMSTTDGEISQSLAKNTLSMLEKQAANIKANALAEFSKTTTATPSIKVNPTADYKGGSSTQKAIEDAAEAAKKAAEEVKEAFEETFDFFDQRVKVLDNALELLKTNVDNVTGTFAKNNLIDAELSITEEKFKNYTDALSMYTEKANEALSKLPSDIAAKIKDGAVDLTTFIGDGNEEVVEAIKDYQNWADKIADCKQELAELKTAIRQLELEKFNNIMEDFTNQFDLREDGKDLITKQIELLKEAGQLIGESFYTTQIEQSKKQLSTLEEEKAKLVEQMTSAISSGRVNHNALTCSNAG